MTTDTIARGLALRSPYVLDQSAVQVSHTGDTNEFTFATITLPANAMGANGQIEIRALFTNNNSAGSKTGRIKFGGTTIFSNATTTTLTEQIIGFVANRNATNSQIAPATGSFGTGTGTSAVTTMAIDTTAAVTILLTGQLGTGTDSIVLERYQVTVYPKG
jgi:hypothetical protein